MLLSPLAVKLPPAPPANPSGSRAEGTQLLRALSACPDLNSSVGQLLRTLITCTGAQRAALGWTDHGHTCVAAQLRADTAGEVALEPAPTSRASMLRAAMDEAIDQGVLIAVGDGQAPSDWVTVAHRQAMAGHSGTLATLPLPGDQYPLGAVCLQWVQTPTPQAFQIAQDLLTLAAPWLALQRQAGRPWHWHVRRAGHASWQAMRHGDHRRHWLLAGLVVAVLTLVPLPDEVGAMARIEGAQQRVLVAPTDGFIKATHAHPGDRVKAQQVLADLAEQDLRIERDKWQAQVAQQDNAYAGAMTRADRSEAALALSRLEEAQAQLALIDEQLQRSQLRAPFDGVLIQGDLSQSIGAPVKQGDALMTVASTQHFRAILSVDEHDIARVQTGQTGEIRLSALPWDGVNILIKRITPLAVTQDNRQVFEVQAEFTGKLPEGLRPGLMGQGQIDTGYRPVLWRWLRPLVDRLALLGWSWWG